jgi:hypothetical protein
MDLRMTEEHKAPSMPFLDVTTLLRELQFLRDEMASIKTKLNQLEADQIKTRNHE